MSERVREKEREREREREDNPISTPLKPIYSNDLIERVRVIESGRE